MAKGAAYIDEIVRGRRGVTPEINAISTLILVASTLLIGISIAMQGRNAASAAVLKACSDSKRRRGRLYLIRLAPAGRGQAQGAKRNVVLLNAAAALFVAGRAPTLADGLTLAANAI